ncbi:MAG: cob(I)yrinic acid a,c-diamide adenosyltransferase [Candidatus Abyssobacteria bacterium SURF_5]|uniref:Corrinoid adenosyltransferase n=1 Tax=Abyssobacteria bacterium (strain SURF_5) TaxID=2093360 RepID=A0A3A4NL95_ABYX5|nr:MAG: cob(I)yrinic acid a,c-diamide adenosyltransferase [Candidatus Abyssubacteria bacterium SURF_5]
METNNIIKITKASRMKITTKKGDTGRTSLLDKNKLVAKTDLRKVINGTLDEVNSVLGLARASCPMTSFQRLILRVQEELFMIGSEVAASPDDVAKVKNRISARHVRRLENGMNSIEKRMPMPENFVVPGTTQVSAMLDIARTFVRRAERSAVEARNSGIITSTHLMKYFNRLSDYLFTLARYYEFVSSGKAEWPPPRKW